MSVKTAIISQGVRPHGVLGWVTAWIMQAMSDTYCGDLAELLQLQPDDEVLDVACGSGVFLNKRGSCARYIAGIDHSDIQLRLARKRNRARIEAGTAEIVRGDSTSLPWPDDRFTAVTCNCVGCFAQPAAALQEMHRVLRAGGRAAFSFDRYPDEAKARKAQEWSGMAAWAENEIPALLTRAGFANVTLHPKKNNVFAGAVKQ